MLICAPLVVWMASRTLQSMSNKRCDQMRVSQENPRIPFTLIKSCAFETPDVSVGGLLLLKYNDLK